MDNNLPNFLSIFEIDKSLYNNKFTNIKNFDICGTCSGMTFTCNNKTYPCFNCYSKKHDYDFCTSKKLNIVNIKRV